jgi:hypothetical protein
MYGHMMIRFLLLYPLCNRKEPGGIDRHKKTPAFQGSGVTAHSPHLADAPPELAPFLPCAGGLPGFVGPFPSTSLDESDITHDSVVYVRTMRISHKHCLTLFLFYGKDMTLVNCKKRENSGLAPIDDKQLQPHKTVIL